MKKFDWVAIIFYGQPRFFLYKYGHTNTLNQFSNYRIKPFFCLWKPSLNDHNISASWSNVTSNMYHSLDPAHYSFPKDSIHRFYDSPKLSNVISKLENRQNSFDYNLPSKRNLYALISQLFILEKSFRLLEETIIKDNLPIPKFIVTTRTDVWLRNKIKLHDLNFDNIYVSDEHDRFPDNIIIYPGKFYNKLNFYSKLEDVLDEINNFSAESIKYEHIKSINLNSQIIAINFRYSLIRNELSKKEFITTYFKDFRRSSKLYFFN